MIQIYTGKIRVLLPRCLEDWVLTTRARRNRKLYNTEVRKANQIIYE